VIDVHVRQHDGLDVARRDSERAELRTRLLLALDFEPHGMAEIGVPARQDVQARVRPGIDQDHSVAMFDREGVDRQPVRPIFVEQRRQPPRESVAPAHDLRILDLDRPGLNRMDAHG
jgi:hypothetical protein